MPKPPDYDSVLSSKATAYLVGLANGSNAS